MIVLAPVDLYRPTSLSDLVGMTRDVKLSVAGPYDAEPFRATRALFRHARGERRLVILETGSGGTHILTYADDRVVDELRLAIIRFVDAIAAREGGG